MNIVYRLKNITKKKGSIYYIGSKHECKVVKQNNINIIIDNKNEMRYIGSSSSQEMKNDILKKNVFTAEILAIVPKGIDLLKIEANYLNKVDAKNNLEYYNLTNNTIGGLKACHSCVINVFGETLSEYASSKSGVSKRTKNAKKLGFNSFHEAVLFIHKEFQKTNNFAEVARTLKVKRHSPSNIIKNINLHKCEKEINNYCPKISLKIQKLYFNKASFHKIAKIHNLELSTVTMYLQDFIDKKGMYLTAQRAGFTEEKLTKEIVKLFLQGMSIVQACKKLNVNSYSGKRYFNNYLRKRLDINDI